MPSQTILHTAPAEDGLQKRCASRPKDFHGLCNRTLFLSLAIRDSGLVIFAAHIASDYLPNVKDEPRPWLARAVLLGARIVTAMVVGSGALLASVFFIFDFPPLQVIHWAW